MVSVAAVDEASMVIRPAFPGVGPSVTDVDAAAAGAALAGVAVAFAMLPVVALPPPGPVVTTVTAVSFRILNRPRLFTTTSSSSLPGMRIFTLGTSCCVSVCMAAAILLVAHALVVPPPPPPLPPPAPTDEDMVV